MPNNDREVFDTLTANSESSVEINYLTYAVFAFHKREWMNQFELQKHVPPQQADIDAWIANLTPHQFASMRSEATNFFDHAARDYMAEDLAAAVAAAQQAELVKAVKAASGFWKQLFVGLMTAVLTPFIIAGFIVLGVVFSSRFPSPIDIAKWFGFRPVLQAVPSSELPRRELDGRTTP